MPRWNQPEHRLPVHLTCPGGEQAPPYVPTAAPCAQGLGAGGWNPATAVLLRPTRPREADQGTCRGKRPPGRPHDTVRSHQWATTDNSKQKLEIQTCLEIQNSIGLCTAREDKG